MRRVLLSALLISVTSTSYADRYDPMQVYREMEQQRQQQEESIARQQELNYQQEQLQLQQQQLNTLRQMAPQYNYQGREINPHEFRYLQ